MAQHPGVVSVAAFSLPFIRAGSLLYLFTAFVLLTVATRPWPRPHSRRRPRPHWVQLQLRAATYKICIKITLITNWLSRSERHKKKKKNSVQILCVSHSHCAFLTECATDSILKNGSYLCVKYCIFKDY